MTHHHEDQTHAESGPPKVTASEVELIEQARLDELLMVLGPLAKETLEEAIDHFVHQTPGMIEAIAQALTDQAYEQVAKIAHKLRGGSITIGANRVGSYCTQLETHLHEQATELLSSDLASLQAAYEATEPLLLAFRASLSTLEG